MADFIAGLCAGIAQVSVGHPFDTAKVLIQNNKRWLGLPLKSYYRGWRFPLTSASFFNCTVFPMYERTIEYTGNSFLSGAISGLVVTPIVYAFDIGKIRQQTKQKLKLSHFYRSKGFASTMAREVGAMTTYFGTYNYLKDKDLHPLISGGLAGLSNWTMTYPIDVIRSRQIAQNITIRQAINMGNLWKGYSVCATRALIVNAAIFGTYEKTRELLDK